MAINLIYFSTVPQEREVFRREQKAGMYKLMSYYIAKQVAEFPLQILAPAVFATVLYWCVGLPADIWVFGTFLSLVMLMTFAVSGLGLFIGACLPAQAASMAIPCILLTALLLAGFYVNPENLGPWIDWAKYTSIFFYAYQGVIVNQFEDLDLYCKNDQVITLTATAQCSNGDEISVTETVCPITSGNQIIETNDSDQFEIWQYQLIILAYGLLMRVLLYPALKYADPKEANA